MSALGKGAGRRANEGGANAVQRHRHLALLAALTAFLCASPAAEPELKHLYPAAGQQGAHVAVSFAGKAEPWPPRVWTDSPGVVFTATPITGTFNVAIAADAAPGPHLIRLFNEEGASAPRFFIVSREPELREAEPNDAFDKPQPLAVLPATLSGRLDKPGDVDGFAVTLQQGQTLVAWIEAYVLGSACDPFLRIVDDAGRLLAFNHDDRTLDPFLAWTAPRDGTFIVQVMAMAHPASSSVQLTGGEGCVYRLHLRGGPVVRFTSPLAVMAGVKSALRLSGWNLPAKDVEFDATQLAAGAAGAGLAGFEALEPILISAAPDAAEHEPNDGAANAQPLPIPSAVTARIGAANDEDWFSFTATKGRAYALALTAARAGSLLDAWLRIEGADAKELARNDDAAGSRDPRLVWTAPTDGVFTIAVGDIAHRGGDDFIYRLAISAVQPTVAATSASHAVSVQAGKTGEVKVNVKRAHGFAAKLQLVAKELPAGISAPAVEVPDKDGEVTLKLTAEATAAPIGQPLTLVLREVEGGREHGVRYSLVSTSEDNGVPQGYAELVIESTEQLWLTVTAAAK